MKSLEQLSHNLAHFIMVNERTWLATEDYATAACFYKQALDTWVAHNPEMFVELLYRDRETGELTVMETSRGVKNG